MLCRERTVDKKKKIRRTVAIRGALNGGGSDIYAGMDHTSQSMEPAVDRYYQCATGLAKNNQDSKRMVDSCLQYLQQSYIYLNSTSIL